MATSPSPPAGTSPRADRYVPLIPPLLNCRSLGQRQSAPYQGTQIRSSLVRNSRFLQGAAQRRRAGHCAPFIRLVGLIGRPLVVGPWQASFDRLAHRADGRPRTFLARKPPRLSPRRRWRRQSCAPASTAEGCCSSRAETTPAGCSAAPRSRPPGASHDARCSHRRPLTGRARDASTPLRACTSSATTVPAGSSSGKVAWSGAEQRGGSAEPEHGERSSDGSPWTPPHDPTSCSYRVPGAR